MFTQDNNDPAMQLAEQLKRKWAPIIDHPDLNPISESYKKNVTAVLLENQEQAMREQGLFEAAPTNAIGAPNTTDGAGGVKTFNPVLISLVRRAMPNLMAYDVCGVQPMTGPTGLIFALKAKYDMQSGNEGLGINEPHTKFGGSGSTGYGGVVAAPEDDPFAGVTGGIGAIDDYTTTRGYATSAAEALGDENPSNKFAEMAFTIDRTSVVARTRALKAEYTTELAQDLKAVHGLDAETELSNILSNEILAEINREVIRTINTTAKLGCQQADLYNKGGAGTSFDSGVANDGIGGIYSLIRDSDGRWSSERFAGLLFQIERECNTIAKTSRRGKGNIMICSSDVASALTMAGYLSLEHAPGSLKVDDTGNTFVGSMRGGGLKVYVDPYAGVNYCTVGYKGSSPYDAGLFYCPYVPLQMVRAVGENTFQPKIGFKTRYGMVNNPFVGVSASDPLSAAAARANYYYRIFRVDSLHGINSGAQEAG